MLLNLRKKLLLESQEGSHTRPLGRTFYSNQASAALPPACFCFPGYSYRIAVTLDGPILPNLGFMFVALVGKYGSTKEHQLHV